MKNIFKNLTVQVVFAIFTGILIGYLFPDFGVQLKILVDIFIKMIKMVIGPIIFLTIVLGFASMGDMKKIGKIGTKSLIYFEVVTTFALVIGLVVMLIVRPGDGLDTSGASKGAADVAKIAEQAAGTSLTFKDFILSIVPDSAIGAFTSGSMLPILFFALLFAVALSSLGDTGKPLIVFFEKINDVFFKIVSMIMRVSPLAAGGAMAYTIGNFGIESLFSLGKMLGAVYATMFVFVVVVLGAICKFYGFSIFNLIKHIKEEIILVLGTSSSESALPSLIDKMQKYGCSKSITGFVVPTGYAFNPDGQCIYYTMACLFIAQAYGIDLSWTQIAIVLGVLMLTSKGSAGVTGSAIITLAATLTSLPGSPIPVEGIALLLGVDRFMSEARAITNLIGNAVATVVLAKSENQFNHLKEYSAEDNVS
ncbi:C4-dicarboxylate transporter DctA [Cytobacillus depressus]|uniref:C4-dicarboxylate transporter DctA n=1 Tax=Cytobacillus depressus TaxID=1602942 RepID=A0A6L3VGQ2_9BACI|nr:C4-dicarboxylate transporter DctA [Cytobacillus depressus]KAB2338405.1 C4-dicarboxylate transporter DctA [Cytobacillus depressus]